MDGASSQYYSFIFLPGNIPLYISGEEGIIPESEREAHLGLVDFITKIRSEGIKTPILALTSLCSTEQINQANIDDLISAGADHVLTQPAYFTVLNPVLDELLSE